MARGMAGTSVPRRHCRLPAALAVPILAARSRTGIRCEPPAVAAGLACPDEPHIDRVAIAGVTLLALWAGPATATWPTSHSMTIAEGMTYQAMGSRANASTSNML